MLLYSVLCRVVNGPTIVQAGPGPNPKILARNRHEPEKRFEAKTGPEKA